MAKNLKKVPFEGPLRVQSTFLGDTFYFIGILPFPPILDPCDGLVSFIFKYFHIDVLIIPLLRK